MSDRYAVISAHREQYPVTLMCAALDVYVPTREGWLYLAVVLDLASRRVIGWAGRGPGLAGPPAG